MALRFLIQAINPVEGMAAPLFFRHCVGVKTAAAATTLPERPKKPHSGYVKFVSDTIPKLKQQMPGSKSTEVLVKASELWKDLDLDTKKRYNDEYAASKDKWVAEVTRFEASLSAEARDQLIIAERRAREQRRENMEKRQRRRQLADHQMPRKPANAFMLYVMDRQATRGVRDQKEFVTALAKEWAVKTDSEKAPFLKRYSDAKERYVRELTAWERKMIKEGRADLVRVGSQPIIEIEEPPKFRS